MVSKSLWVGLLLFFGGLVLVADAVRRGSASLSLILIVPVISGSSAEFVLGAIALFAGILALFVSFTGPWEVVPAGPTEGGGSGGSGGVVLIGPIPIFFGSARPASRRTVLRWTLLGLALTVVLGILLAASVYRF